MVELGPRCEQHPLAIGPAALRIAAGDVVTVACHWDNTFGNPYLQRLLHDLGLVAPIDMHLGGATTDEMCAVHVGIAVPTLAR